MSSTPAQKLRLDSAAVRLSFRWLGTNKSLPDYQLEQAAKTFEADRKLITAKQKIFDTKHPAFQKLSSIKTTIVNYWKSRTLPYVEDGIRLLPKKRVDEFNTAMASLRTDLLEAVAELRDHYEEIMDESKARLGKLFNAQHYPTKAELQNLIDVEWNFPSVEPPDYLAQINPDLYLKEQERAAAAFKEAVRLAETAFLEEFQNLVNNLQERLTPDADGKKKTFKDTTLTNLLEFFDKFQKLNVGSNHELDLLVKQAQVLVSGIGADDLRKSELLRKDVTKGIAALNSSLGPLVINAPRRKITRPNQPKEQPWTNGSANSASASIPLKPPTSTVPSANGTPAEPALFA